MHSFKNIPWTQFDSKEHSMAILDMRIKSMQWHVHNQINSESLAEKPQDVWYMFTISASEDDSDDLIDWLNEVCGRFHYNWDLVPDPTSFLLFIKDKQDAILFKLTWAHRINIQRK
jgi:hypothetical protein